MSKGFEEGLPGPFGRLEKTVARFEEVDRLTLLDRSNKFSMENRKKYLELDRRLFDAKSKLWSWVKNR